MNKIKQGNNNSKANNVENDNNFINYNEYRHKSKSSS